MDHLSDGDVTAASTGVFVDGREFATHLDAAMHLLWLLQRLSYMDGRPADGPRFRDAILETRKLIERISYKPGLNASPSNVVSEDK